MNYITKTLLPVILLWAFIPYGISQNETFDTKKISIKPFYTVEANFGISTFINTTPQALSTFKTKLAYQTLVYGANFAGGIELAPYLKVGLGLGYFYYKQDDTRHSYPGTYSPNTMTTHGIPLFLYLRSDFLDRKISPYIDFKIGNNFLITKETLDCMINFNPSTGKFQIVEIGNFKLNNGLFLAPNIGVAFKTDSKVTVNTSIGYRYVSRNYLIPSSPDYFSDNPDYFNIGNITVDHQFILGVGVSF